VIAYLLFALQFSAFLISLCLLPATIGWVAAGPKGLCVGVLSAIGVALLDSLRVQSIFLKALKPTSVFLYGKKIYRIEDASSHLFVTRGPWMSSKVWITRGAFSLLSQAELNALVLQARKAQPYFKLGFESYLTTLILRLEKGLPQSVLAIMHPSVGVAYPVRPRDVILSLPILGLMTVISVFYGRTLLRPSTSRSVRTALSVLERESRVCSPEMSPSLANHALVAPWPHAFIRFGRSCLS